MTSVNKGSGSTSRSAHSTGADKSAFVERLQTILAHWPSADRLARAMGVGARGRAKPVQTTSAFGLKMAKSEA